MKIGLTEFIDDVRYRRYRFRQFTGVFFFVLVLTQARPVRWALAAGACVVTAGLLVRLWAAGFIRKDKALATDGPYALARHPLYLGNLLLGIGFSLASGLWWAFVLWGLIYALYYVPAVQREDMKLRKLFPDQWSQWAAHVPAVVPRRLRGAGGWSLRQCAHNGEPLFAAILVAGLVYLLHLLP